MKILLSPAKSINFNKEINTLEYTQPRFIENSVYLISKLKKISENKIEKMMGINKDLSKLNFERFQKWEVPFTNENSKPCAEVFSGAVYQGLDFSSLSENNKLKSQDYIRILSGLYGLLKPLDLMQPYRLEMGVKFVVTPKMKNLYLYWGDKLSNSLDKELDNDDFPILVNLASAEYFKAAKLDRIKHQVVTPIFKDMSKNGEYKIIMTYAKKARGLMARYIIENELTSIESLKSFDSEGYKYLPSEIRTNEMVFIR